MARLALLFPVVQVVYALVGHQPSMARTWLINPEGTGDAPTIQAAINASAHGDTVLVEPGLFGESIDFAGKSILVGSRFVLAGDTTFVSQTVISSYIGPLVQFASGENRNSRLSGLTISGGHANNGAGIFCSATSPTLDNLVIIENTAHYYGGGICVIDGDPLVMACAISDNIAYIGNGGGIACFRSAMVIEGNYIQGNSASESGGGIFAEESAPVITNNRIISNDALGYYGGGIGSRNCTPIITDNYIAYNEGGQFGGGLFY